MKNILDVFFTKNGKSSKTSIFLSIATVLLLGMWTFQSLFHGVEFFDWWTIPEFNTGAATSVMTILSTLYLVNHSPLVNGKTSTQPKEDKDGN